MNIIKFLQLMVSDASCICIIIAFIKFLYIARYGRIAEKYIEKHIYLLGINSVYCFLILRLYYVLESKFQLDSRYTNGIILTLFLFFIGITTKKSYKHKYLKNSVSRELTQNEYLFILSASFLTVSVKFVFEGIIGLSVPLAMLLGRYIWIDTESIKSIKSSLYVDYIRTIESSILLLCGILIISIVDFVNEGLSPYKQILFAFLYGVLLLFPYRIISEKLKI